MPRKKLHKATLKGTIALYKKRKLPHPVSSAKTYMRGYNDVKGMCYAANQNPDKIFKLGIKASLEPKKHEKNKKDNVIDFLSYLKKKRDEEQFEEEMQDPF